MKKIFSILPLTGVESQAAVSASVGYGSVFNGAASASAGRTVSDETAKRLSEETRHVRVRTKGGPRGAVAAKDDVRFFLSHRI